MTKRRKPLSLLRWSERLLTSVRKAIYSDWLSCLRRTSHSSELSCEKCVRFPTSWESKLDPDTSRRAGPLLHSEPRLSAKARRSRDAGIGPVVVPREGAFLASVWTIVAVAGQTQEHPATLVARACRDRAIDRATTVRKALHSSDSGRITEFVSRSHRRRYRAVRSRGMGSLGQTRHGGNGVNLRGLPRSIRWIGATVSGVRWRMLRRN